MPAARPYRTIATAAASISAALALLAGPATAHAQPEDAHTPDSHGYRYSYNSGDRLGLVDNRDVTAALGSSGDRVAVWVCHVPSNTRHPAWQGRGHIPATPASVTAWANDHITPATLTASGGQWQPVFLPAGTLPMGPDDGPEHCRDQAVAATDWAENVLAVDTTGNTTGYASIGSLATHRAGLTGHGTIPPASDTWRGATIGGGTLRLGSLVAVHELGHTLGWSHSRRHGDEYANRHDLMSGGRQPFTPAINRYAAGWLQTDDIAMLTVAGPADIGDGAAAMAVAREADGSYSTFEVKDGHVLIHTLGPGGPTNGTIDLHVGPLGDLWPADGTVTVGSWTVDTTGSGNGHIRLTGRPADSGPLDQIAVTWAKAVWSDLAGIRIDDTAAHAWLAGTVARLGAHTSVTQLAANEHWLGQHVRSWYTTVLDRAGTKAEHQWWIDQIATGRWRIDRAAAWFYASDEWRNKHRDDRAWIDALYRAILGRGSEPAGTNWWATIAQTHGRETVAWNIYQSVESRLGRTQILYRALLGRDADETGANWWAAKILTDGDLHLAGTLATSAEYLQRALNQART